MALTKLTSATRNDIAQSYEFPTITEFKVFDKELPVGKVISFTDKLDDFIIQVGSGGDDVNVIENTNTGQIAVIVEWNARYIPTSASVSALKNGSLINGSEVTAATLDSTSVTVITTNYYDNYTVDEYPSGGSSYLLTTLANARFIKDDVAWTPDGFGEHYLFGGVDYVAILKLTDRVVNIDQFGARGDGSYVHLNIQAALDYFPDKCVIEGGSSRAYALSDGFIISGERKKFDMLGLRLDFVINGGTGVQIGLPLTEDLFMEFSNCELWFDQAVGDCIGVQLIGKNMHPRTTNLSIHRVGANAGAVNGVGFEVKGGVNKTPFFGVHTNIRVIDCETGIFLNGDPGDGTTAVTTQTFIGAVAVTCPQRGIWMRLATSNTFMGYSIEFCGTGLLMDYCGRNHFYGGLNEGSSPQFTQTNQASAENFIMSPITAMAGGDNWKENPAVYTNERFTLRTVGMPLFTQSIGETNDLGIIGRGKLIVQNRRGTWAEILLSTTGDTSTKLQTILTQFSADGAFAYTTVKDTASKINIYWDSGSGTYKIQNNSVASSVTTLSFMGE